MANLFRLITTAGDRLGALITRLEELHEEEFPTKGPKAFIELLLKVSSFLSRILEEQSERIHNNIGSEDSIAKQIKSVANDISDLSSWLRFIESSKSEYTPIEFVRIIDSLGKKLYLNGEIIIRPQSQYNWEFRELVSEIKKKLLSFRHVDTSGILQNSPDFIVILSFPNVEKDNLFLHTGTLIHEFGHYFDIINNISAKAETSFDNTKLNELIKYYIQTMEPKPKEDEIYKVHRALNTSIKEKLQKLFLNWIQESIADLIAIRIGGPGAFFSFADQAILEPSLDDYTKDERYPSFRIRLLKMFEELREIGFTKEKFDEWSEDKDKVEVSKLLHSELQKWQELLEIDGKEIFDDNDKTRREIEIVKKSYFETFHVIRKKVIDRLNEFENINTSDTIKFSTNVFEREVFHLVGLLQKGISPNEIITRKSIEGEGKTHPAKWASILNAGWLWAFLSLDKPTIYSENYVLDRVKIKNDMFLQIIKAIERSEIHKQFLNIKSKFGDL